MSGQENTHTRQLANFSQTQSLAGHKTRSTEIIAVWPLRELTKLRAIRLDLYRKWKSYAREAGGKALSRRKRGELTHLQSVTPRGTHTRTLGARKTQDPPRAGGKGDPCS